MNNQDFSDLSIEEKRKIITQRFNEASKLQGDIAITTGKTVLLASSESEEPILASQEPLPSVEKEVQELYKLINSVSIKEIPKAIAEFIEPSNPNYFRYINMLKVLIYKEMSELSNIAFASHFMYESDFDEMFQETSELLASVSDVEEEEELIVSSQNAKNTLFFRTSLNRVILYEEIDKNIPTDMYPQVLELIKGLVNGEFKNLKYLYARKIFEVRLDELRLTFARLTNNKFLVLNCFVKKYDTNRNYREKMSRVSGQYRDEKAYFLAKCDDPEFIEEHQKYLDDIMELCETKGRRKQ